MEGFKFNSIFIEIVKRKELKNLPNKDEEQA